VAAVAGREQTKQVAFERRQTALSEPERWLIKGARALIVGLARGLVDFERIGIERLPDQGPFIVAPVHRSYLDTPLVGALTSRPMRYMAKDSLFRNPVAGRLLSAVGGFPIERGAADRDAIRRCLEVLGAGEPLVVFPEGTRRFGGRVGPVQEGTGYLAARAQVRVFPVGVAGTEEVLPRGSRVPRFHRVVLVVGEPLEPPPASGAKVARSELRSFAEELGAGLQVAFDQARRQAGLPVWGSGSQPGS
jgi:1-acyl-sn-glycerol-3-phosphate acyltransferase